MPYCLTVEEFLAGPRRLTDSERAGVQEAATRLREAIAALPGHGGEVVGILPMEYRNDEITTESQPAAAP